MSTRFQSFTNTLTRIGMVAVFFLVFVARVFAATTTTVFPLEDFSGASFPPSGWTDNSFGGWYSSANGDGGSNGSAVVNVWNCYNAEMTTPTMDASAFATSADTLYLEFDFWSEEDYYSANYGGDEFDVNVYDGLGGSTQIKTFNSSIDFTYDNSSSLSYYSDPLTSSSDWKHIKLAIPPAFCTSTMQIGFHGWTPKYACGGNFAIDNVVVSSTIYSYINFSPSTLDFGTALFGTTSTAQSIVVNNPNSTAVTLNTPILGGSQPGDFNITRAPSSIGANSSDSFLVTFSPIATGARSATITVGNSSDGPNPIVVNVKGLCVAPTISIAPSILFAGSLTRLHSSRDQFVLVTSGGAGGLTVSPATNITGDYPGEYQIIKLPSTTIPPGQSDTIWIRYSPTQEGSRTAVLNILSNGVNGPQTVRLLGVGILPRLVIAPDPLNFDSVAIGSTMCDSIMLWNPGTDTIAITRNYFTSADGDFQLSTLTGMDTLIPPDGKKYVQVCFTPQRSGSRAARFRVTTNIPLTFDRPAMDTSSFSVNIVGEGVPYGVLSVRGTPVVDSEIVGQQLCTTDTLYNNGSADLTITSDSLSGPNASEYKITNVTLPITIHPGGSYVFDVCVTPAARGDRNAMLNVTSLTNGKSATSQLVLDVFGQLVCASVSSQATGFPATTCVGSMDTAHITVTNCGDVMTIYTGAISASATQYQIVGAKSTAGISAGGTATYEIVFAPTTRGSAPGTLTITGTGGINQTINFDGTGGAASVNGSGTANLTQVGKTTTFAATVTNSGECDWSPGVPTISGANAADFTCVGNTSKIIAAGKTDTLTFAYHPTAVANSTATATFPNGSEASLPNPASVTLAGTSQTQSVSRLTEAEGFSLGQNYPNPFNPTTEIRFTLPQESNVQLDIVDMTGRIVRNVLATRMSAGEHGTVVNAADLSSGVYYYQLTAGNIKLTRQMILTK